MHVIGLGCTLSEMRHFIGTLGLFGCCLVSALVTVAQTRLPVPKIVVKPQSDKRNHGADPKLWDSVKRAQQACKTQSSPPGGAAFNVPRSVGESMGGRVKTIMVLRSAVPGWPPRPTSKVRETLRKVWNGKFDGASCFPFWAEHTFWPIEAELEFEDGTHGLLITDGWHVVFQDHDGRIWFLRLMPNAPTVALPG